MGCSCSGGTGGPPAAGAGGSGSGGGRAIEPFPRQTLVGLAGGTMSYWSEIYDATHWKSIAWWLEVYGSLPGVTGLPVRAFIETSEDRFGPWVQMIPGGQAAGPSERYTGAVSNPGRFVRARIDVAEDETSVVAFRFVVRIS